MQRFRGIICVILSAAMLGCLFLCSCRSSPLLSAEYADNQKENTQVEVRKLQPLKDTEDEEDTIIEDNSEEIQLPENAIANNDIEETAEIEDNSDDIQKEEIQEDPITEGTSDNNASEEDTEQPTNESVEEPEQETVQEEIQQEPVQEEEPVQVAVVEPVLSVVPTQPTVEQTVVQEPVYTYTDMNTTMWTTSNLNIRSGPTVNFDCLGTVNNGSAVVVTGQCNETGWYRIDYNGQVGYCSNEYVTDVQPVVYQQSNVETTVQQETTQQETVQTDLTANNNSSQNTTNQIVRLSSPYVTTEGTISDAIYNNAVNSFNDLPTWVKNLFAEKNWVICVSALDFASRYGFSGIGGLTVYADKTIFVCNDEGCTSRDCIWHEMGHFVDYQIGQEIGGRPSNTDEFADITAAEGQTMKDYFNWYISSITVSEYFAEATYFYWDRPSQLKQVAPRTYAYLDNILGNR